MRVSNLRDIIKAAQIDPTLYSFEGERHESLCLLAFGQSWKVFISERGQRHEERSFTAEDVRTTPSTAVRRSGEIISLLDKSDSRIHQEMRVPTPDVDLIRAVLSEESTVP